MRREGLEADRTSIRWAPAVLIVAFGAVSCTADARPEPTPLRPEGAPTSGVDRHPVSLPAAPTIDELLNRGEPLLIAHQGGDTVYPSSTLFAFGEAVRDGADLIELDVRRSADGEIVVIHDSTVDRTTDGTGSVAELTAAELRELDAGFRFTPCDACPRPNDREFPYRGIRTGEHPPPAPYRADDFGVPTLREVARRYPGVALDIEIKDGLDMVEPLAEELRALGRTSSTVVVANDQPVVDAFRSVAPEIETSPASPLAPLDDYRIVHVRPFVDWSDRVTDDIVTELHDRGVAIWVYMRTDDRETGDFYRSLLAEGADGLIVGRPDEAADTIARWP